MFLVVKYFVVFIKLFDVFLYASTLYYIFTNNCTRVNGMHLQTSPVNFFALWMMLVEPKGTVTSDLRANIDWIPFLKLFKQK